MSVAEYFDNLAKHGRTYKAGDATSQEALEARWKVMAEPIESWDTVLEAGCGYGGFANHLRETRPHIGYHGVDVSPKQIQLAGEWGHWVGVSDVLDVDWGHWDYVVGQGLFYKQENHDDCRAILAKMWELATKAVVVTTILDGEENELHFNVSMLLSWVRELGCTKWTLRHDYHPNDVCLYLYK